MFRIVLREIANLTFSRNADQPQLKQGNILNENMCKHSRKVQWETIQAETDTHRTAVCMRPKLHAVMRLAECISL